MVSPQLAFRSCINTLGQTRANHCLLIIFLPATFGLYLSFTFFPHLFFPSLTFLAAPVGRLARIDSFLLSFLLSYLSFIFLFLVLFESLLLCIFRFICVPVPRLTKLNHLFLIFTVSSSFCFI